MNDTESHIKNIRNGEEPVFVEGKEIRRQDLAWYLSAHLFKFEEFRNILFTFRYDSLRFPSIGEEIEQLGREDRPFTVTFTTFTTVILNMIVLSSCKI